MIVGLMSWLLASLLFYLLDEERGVLSFYLSLLLLHGLVLFGFLFYRLFPRLIRNSQGSGRYVLWVLGLLLGSLPIVFTVSLVLTNDAEATASFALVNSLFQLVITCPLAWALFQRQARRIKQVAALESELGQTNANLDFLRSQINPHFLFNALNTLYGLALQENSERTADGIQRLGDMMRFMLHENQQPRILLARELEYLRNYIELQSLRIAASPGIRIEISIEEVPEGHWIAPMLLIPFVENAFKHGMSLKQASWIQVVLKYAPGKIYFDVCNSLHPRAEKDRLQESSGLGLANVRQRLALLYPDQHELLISQTPKEYIVHLALDL
jgi:two-component system LytT family sensor kinase